MPADAARPIEPGWFDLAYARLLLSHLIDPAAAVRAMRAEVRPGGLVATEDLFLGTLGREPPVAALDDLQEIYGATIRHHCGDPTIGPRLVALLDASGLEQASEKTVSIPMLADRGRSIGGVPQHRLKRDNRPDQLSADVHERVGSRP